MAKLKSLSYDKLKCECNVFRSVINECSKNQDKLAEAEFQKEKAKNDAKNKTTEKPNVDKVKQITQFVLTLSGAEVLQQLYLVAVTAGYTPAPSWSVYFPHLTELTPVT